MFFVYQNSPLYLVFQVCENIDKNFQRLDNLFFLFLARRYRSSAPVKSFFLTNCLAWLSCLDWYIQHLIMFFFHSVVSVFAFLYFHLKPLLDWNLFAKHHHVFFFISLCQNLYLYLDLKSCFRWNNHCNIICFPLLTSKWILWLKTEQR